MTLTQPPAASRETGAPPETATPDPTPADARASDAAGPLRLLLLRMHFYAGVLVGPFLLVAAVSGLLYALAPAAESVVYRTLLTASSSSQTVPLHSQVATARTHHPDLAVSGIIPGSDGATTRVLFADPTLPSTSYSRVVFVDPADGSVRGDTVQYGSSQALPLRTWISELHKKLHLGAPGRIYSELAASWLAPLTLGGLWLWWDRRRRLGTPMLRLRRGLTGRARTRTRHAVAGTWAAVGLIGLAATGLTWSTYAGENVADLRTAMNWTTPSLKAGPGTGAAAGSEHAGHDGHAGHATPAADPTTPVDTARELARNAGLVEPVQLTPPKSPGGQWKAAETRRSWTAGPDSAIVDPATGAVTQTLRFADYPLAAKLTDWGIRVHMGFLFGIANQLLLAALAAVLVGIVLRGYRMWWTRRPTRGGLARPPVRGSLGELVRRRPVVSVACAITVAALGWAVPLLGVSLLAFLAVDVLLSAASRVSARRRVAG